MIGVNFVHDSDEVLFSLDLNLNSNKYSVDVVDFDNQSFEEYSDYLNFFEFDRYLFINLNASKRLEQVVDYLKNLVEINLEVIELTDFCKLFSEEKDDIEKLVEDKLEKQNFDMTVANYNSYLAFKTKIYPMTLEKGVLKHILVDDVYNLITKNREIIKYAAINSVIYTSQKNVMREIPCMLRNSEFLLKADCETVTREKLEEEFSNFVETGKVILKKHIVDYGILTKNSRCNSITIRDNIYYADYQQKFKVGKVGDSYQSVLSRVIGINNLVKDDRYVLKKLYPLLIDINRYNENTVFITALNRYRYQVNDSGNYRWIAYKCDKGNFTFNIEKQRLFKVNDNFIVSFEKIIKNNFIVLDSIDREVLEMIEKYE